MIKHLFITGTIIILFSCGQKRNSSESREVVEEKMYNLADKSAKFLWCENIYNKELKHTFYTMVINEELCKTLTDPEKAALGYVATFVGNECSWDGDYTDDRSNLKCKILTALNLGYQCSDKHLGFLRQMFKNDTTVLKELKSDNCPTTPDGATIQDTFDEISLTVKGNEILVFYKVSGFNLRESKGWNWTKTDYFQLDGDNIRLTKEDMSEVKREHIDVGE